MRVLIIEDESQIARWVDNYFRQAGYDTVVEADGRKGLDRARTWRPDLIILDLNLPEIDGLDICRMLRQDPRPEIAHVLIIMLTARAEEIDRLLGLEIGADDYVTKPFSPREIVARAKAIFRRINRSSTGNLLLTDGDLVVDVDGHEAHLGGQPLSLTPNEFSVLVTLLKHQGRVLKRSRLIELALGYDYEGLERSVDVYIRQLRRKIGDLGGDPERIATVFGVGYRYAG